MHFIYLVLAALGLRCGAWALCCCAQAFSSCSEPGLFSSCGVQASHCSGFSCCEHELEGAQASAAVVQELSFPTACGILVPRPGIEPMYPALAGGFLMTGPLGKSLHKNSRIRLSITQGQKDTAWILIGIVLN